MNMAHLSLSRAVFDQRERRFNWFKPYCITVFPDQQSDCTSDRQTDKYSTVLRIGLRLLRIPTVATAHSKALHGGSVGGCDARGRGRAGNHSRPVCGRGPLGRETRIRVALLHRYQL